jgi:hypothetical protein
VWNYLAERITDDLIGGRQPSNKSNRFEVADVVNALVCAHDPPYGPFWCAHPPNTFDYIPQNQPRPQPFQGICNMRQSDLAAESDFPFRLIGQGSVGSQILTGIPTLHKLRFDEELAKASTVWPFETGWAPTEGIWEVDKARIFHAEIYPSVRAPLKDAINDRGQVRAMWQWARDQDRAGQLQAFFAKPANMSAETEQIVLTEEGWILGVP